MFSAQPAGKSENTSNFLVVLVKDIFFPEYDLLPEAEYLSHMSNLSYLVRKFAHFTEFLLLGGFLSLSISTFSMKPNKQILIGLAIGILYACSDEFHQFFVDARAMQVFDICIDSIGVLFGIFIFTGFIYISRYEQKMALEKYSDKV